MSDAVDRAIAALRSRDATAYREARARYYAAEAAYSEAGKAVADEGKPAYRRLMAAMRAALAPHDIDWRDVPVSGSSDINHAEWTCSVMLGGEIWPRLPGATRFATHACTPIKFTMHPRDGAEFRHIVAALKAAADALAPMLYTAPGDAT